MTDSNTGPSSSSSDASWPAPIRRILTSHLPPSPSPSSSAPPGGSVIQRVDLVPLNPVLSSTAAITPLYSSLSCPTTSTPYITPTQIQASMDAVPGVVLPLGVNCQVTELKPDVKVGMHRTNSVDYNVMVKGWAWHVTPNPRSRGGRAGGEASEGKAGEGSGGDGQAGEEEDVERVRVDVGDVVVQRGTLHAWEAGPDGARWVTTVVAALPVEIDGKALEEVAF